MVKENLLGILYIIFLLSIGLIPNYGALDRIAPQWLCFSLINFLGISIVFSQKKYENDLKNILKFKPLIFLFIFVFWGLLSYFYAINSEEVVVKFVRWINVPISIIVTSLFFKSFNFNPYKLISIFFSLYLLIELYFSYSTYFQIIEISNYDFSLANLIKGSTANKNITAASILIKIPFVFFLIQNSKHLILKTTLSILAFSVFYLVFLLSARASIISTITILILLIIAYLWKYRFTINQKNITSVVCILIPFFFSITLFQLQYSKNNTASIKSRISTINTEDTSVQQRLRYYNHSLNQVITSPLIGVGMGNWKIKSIDYDKENINGYVVPYHTHNDFLEFGAELGIIGILTYFLIFIYSFIILIKVIINEEKYTYFTPSLLIMSCGIIYFVDANLNFPHARPVMQVPFVIILSLLYFTISQKNENI